MDKKVIGDVIQAFLKYVLPFLVAYVLNILMSKFVSKERLRGKLHLIFLKGIIMAMFWVIAALTALSGIPAFSKTWETAIASSGIAAVVLGLAAQSTLANVFSMRGYSVGLIGLIGIKIKALRYRRQG